MHQKQNKNLLPKKQLDRVALKTAVSKNLLSRLLLNLSFRKHPIFKTSRLTKISLGIFVSFYLMGYQPVLSIPPIRKSIAAASESQSQAIGSDSFNTIFTLPHPGYLTTRFSSYHPGIDIAVGYGMPVRPITKGQVIEVIMGFWGLGHYTVVEHDNGFKSTYGHMGKVYVKRGDLVSQNSIMGEVGMTGRTTGPHTHLEITRFGKYIDPLSILPQVQNYPTYANSSTKPSVGGNK